MKNLTGIDLSDFDKLSKEAVRKFWITRELAANKQKTKGVKDTGLRSEVTGGKNMDGFEGLVRDIVVKNGLSENTIFTGRKLGAIPGFFRATKVWDMVIVSENNLVAALEFKSQVGSAGKDSYGKNQNNRIEEALGSSVDLWEAYSNGAFGESPKPFVGWLMLVGDLPDAHKVVNNETSNFEIFPEFKGVSYIKRYNIFCRKLIQEQYYTAASIIVSPPSAVNTGAYEEIDQLTSLKTFITSLAGHIAMAAARLK